MPTPSLHDLLLARVFTPGLADFAERLTGTRITRRRFFSHTGSLGAAVYAMGLDPLTPHLVSEGRAVVVWYRGFSWRIDPTLFGSRARAHWFQDDSGIVVELIRAYLPGTDIDVSFRAQLGRTRRNWRVALAMPAHGFSASSALDAWMSGDSALTASVTTRRLLVGDTALTLSGDDISLSVNPAAGFEFAGGNQCVALGAPISYHGDQVCFEAQPAAAATLREAWFGSRSAATRFTLRGVQAPPDPVVIGSQWARPMSCCSEGALSVSGEVFRHGRSDQGLVVAEGPMRLFADGTTPSPEHPSQIKLERAALTTPLGCDDGVVIAGRVARVSQRFEVGGCQLTISGDDERPFYVDARRDRAQPARLQARLEAVSLPVPGADAATLSVDSRIVDILLSEDAAPPPSDTEATTGVIMLGREPLVAIPLDGGRLTLKRGVDMFNLTFGFVGFDLRVDNGFAWLVRHKPRRGEKWSKATVTVTFPPQHIGEQSTRITLPHNCSDTTGFPEVSRARLSAPSRVVFDVGNDPSDPTKPQWREKPLTIEALTDWTDLALEVNERALEPDASLKAQLNLAGIDLNTKLAELPDRILQQLCAPRNCETALTMSGRLIVSPSRSGRIIPAAGLPDPKSAPLWHARLDTRGRKTVRALWSYFIKPLSFKFDQNGDDLLPLSSKHHWEIVAQTSVYGIPALRRITDDKSPEKEGQAQQPRSRVVRPAGRFDILDAIDMAKGYTDKDSGIALPQPFDDADIILTSIGGSFVADWRGEPPSLLYLDDAAGATGFSLERLQYWSQLGRDIRVEAVDKGYMLPLGIRCSHVQLVERRFFRHPKLRYPVAYLVRRRFIVFGKPEKKFPGEKHPFGGREFPARRIRMLTVKTPDLRPQDEGTLQPTALEGVRVAQGGRVTFDGERKYDIFWPRTPPRTDAPGGDVAFKWIVNDDPVSLNSNLLFVENSAISVERVMKRVVEYDRSLTQVEDALCLAQSGGSRRQYAQAAREGDTSFDTDAWVLSASGQLLAESTGTEAEAFRMDARMEGADQPPVYPIVRKAYVNVQSLDRLLGRPQGSIQVGFTPQYVRHGFNTSLNPSEIYLGVLGPDIALDVSNQGAASGGLAKPNALVVALSRKSGIVGGTKPANAPASADLPTDVSRNVGTTSQYDFRQALEGRFDPKEFLGGIGNAKLLGLIPLSEVLTAIGFDGAPQLFERIGYGALNAVGEQALDFLKGVFRTEVAPNKTITVLVSDATTELGTLEMEGLRFRDLYPVLYQRLAEFSATLTKASGVVLGANTIADTADVITDVVTDGRELLAEIEHTLKYPLPAVAQTALKSIADEWERLKKAINQEYLDLGQVLHRDIVRDPLIALCKSIETEGLGEVLLGHEQGLTCEQIVDHPRDALRQIENTLFAEPFAGQLLRMLAGLRGYASDTTGELAFSRVELQQLLKSAVIQALNDVRDRLQSSSTAGQEQLINLIHNKVVQAVESLPGSTVSLVPSPEERLEKLGTALDQLAEQLTSGVLVKEAFDSVVAAHPELLTPRTIGGGAQLIREFGQALAGRARAAIDQAVGVELRNVRALVVSQIQQARAQAIERILQSVHQVFDSMAASSELARLTAAVRSITAWCQTTTGQVPRVFTVAESLASGLIGTSDEVAAELSALDGLADAIVLPGGAPPEVVAQFERARASLKAGLQQLASIAGFDHRGSARRARPYPQVH